MKNLGRDNLVAVAGALLFVCFVGFAHAAKLSHDESFNGVYYGGGRACYGKLIISPDTIFWSSVFSVCGKTPYVSEAYEKSDLTHDRSIVYRLKYKSKMCRYKVLLLQHVKGMDSDIGWEVTGFQSEDAFRALSPEAQGVLGCPLTH